MREIKFRAWDERYNKYFYHAERTYDNACGGYGCIDSENFGDVLDDTEKYSVEQYTGLHDKNGKEIYEGDIVCTPYIDCIFGDLVGKDIDYDFKFVVNFKDASFVLSNKDRGNIYINEFGSNIEIIGNIHDNPELKVK